MAFRCSAAPTDKNITSPAPFSGAVTMILDVFEQAVPAPGDITIETQRVGKASLTRIISWTFRLILAAFTGVVN